MSFSTRYILLWLFLVLAPWPTLSTDIFTQTMVRIDGYGTEKRSTETLQRFEQEPLIVSFFMPNCRWCERQHKVLSQLSRLCPQLNTVVLGLYGTKQQLRLALKRKKNTFPAYIASQSIIQALGSTQAVPMALYFNHQGKLQFTTQGYTDSEHLTQLLRTYNVSHCV